MEKRYNSITTLRKKFKHTNFLLWETYFELKKILNLRIYLHKVKAHDTNVWNNLADHLANKGRKDTFVTINDNHFTNNVTATFFNINIDTNIRHFIKDVMNIRNDIRFENLARIDEQYHPLKSQSDLLLNWSKCITNTHFQEHQDVNNSDNVDIPQAKRYFNIKKDREKSFKVKKLLNELPVMEILKTRNPKTYLPHFLCPRCSKEKETLTHLWECSKADNDILHLQSTTREYIRNLVYKNKDKFINVETLLDQIYKYTKTRKNLKRHSADNARFYKALGGHKT
jgi:hypothetical protein